MLKAAFSVLMLFSVILYYLYIYTFIYNFITIQVTKSELLNAVDKYMRSKTDNIYLSTLYKRGSDGSYVEIKNTRP